MKFVSDFETFLTDEVNLNQTRLDRLKGSVDAIETFLAGHTTFADSFLDLIPAGSWAQRAIICPVTEDHEFDADVLLYLTEQEDWQPKDYLEHLWATFRSSGTYRDLAHRKTRCVRIDYAGDFHIDVVPYLERGGAGRTTSRTAASPRTLAALSSRIRKPLLPGGMNASGSPTGASSRWSV